MSFFAELKRRNVFKVGTAYAIVAWLLMQITSIVAPALHLPDWTMTLVVYLIIIGLPLALFLAWAYELTPEGIKPTKSVHPDNSITHVTGQRLNYSIIALLSLTVVFLVINNFVLKQAHEGVKEPASTSTHTKTVAVIPAVNTGPARFKKTEITPPPHSIAVLPFVNLSEDKDNGYFADGITEELLNSLTRIKDLDVRGRSSSFYFKGRNEDSHTISKMLNVKYLLEGGVRRAGNQVRISVQLTDTQTDTQLWSNTYDRTLKDIFAVQEDIAKSVASALEINLGVGELGHIPGMTRNVDAYEEFLKGRELYYHLTLKGVEPAIEHFQRALAIDPSFSVAWLSLASVYREGEAMIPGHFEEWQPKVENAIKRAHDATPNSPRVLIYEMEEAGRAGDFKRSGELFDRLQAFMKKSGRDVFELTRTGLFYNQMGRPGKALDYLERARSMDPLDSFTSFVLANAYMLAGRTPMAIAEYKREETMGNNHLTTLIETLMAAIDDGDRDESAKAIAALEQAASKNKNPTVSLFIQLGRHLNEPAAGSAEIKHIMASESANLPPRTIVVLALWAAYYGDPALSLQILRGVRLTSAAGAIPASLWAPVMSKVRELPAFKDYLRDIRLLDYLREPGHWNDFCHPVGTSDFECV